MVKRGPSTQSGNTITSMAAPAPSPFVVEAASSSSQLYPRTIGTSRSELSNSSVVFGESPSEARGSSPDSLICIVHRDSPLRQFGIQYAQSRNDKITVAHVFPETPGALANVPRGMVLRSVDGVVVRDIMEILPLVHGKLTLRLEFEPDAPASRSELSSFF